MSASVPIHGRNHRPGGVDPIPGLVVALGSYEQQILSEPTLIGYWPLDDAAEPALDHSTSGHDLMERFGPPIYGQPGPFPDVPEATSIEFNFPSSTSSGGVSLQDQTAGTIYHFQNLDPYTFEIIVNPSAFDTSGADGIIGVYSGVAGSVGGLYLRLDSSGHIVMNRAGLTFTSTETLTIGDWTHVVMTYDGVTLRLYLDGEEVQANATATNHAYAGELELALHYDGTRYSRFLGKLAQAAIYNEALDASTIANHANSFTGGGSDAGDSGGGGTPSGAAGGALDGTYPNPGLAASVAGAGLTETSDVLSVNVDGTTLELVSDSLRVKDDGITSAKIAADAVGSSEIAAGAVGSSELADTAVTPGSYGDATHVGRFTVDADGRLTAASDVAISASGLVWEDVGTGGVSAFVPVSTIDAKGDLLVGSANDALDNLAVGSNGQVLTADSAQTLGVKWAAPAAGGAVVKSYVEKTTSVTITATAEGSGTTVITAGAITGDGSTLHCVEFYAPTMSPGANAFCILNLWEDSTVIGRIWATSQGSTTIAGMGIFARRYLTPSAGSHTYSVRGWATASSNPQVVAGAGGAAAYFPMFIRVTTGS